MDATEVTGRHDHGLSGAQVLLRIPFLVVSVAFALVSPFVFFPPFPPLSCVPAWVGVHETREGLWIGLLKTLCLFWFFMSPRTCATLTLFSVPTLGLRQSQVLALRLGKVPGPWAERVSGKPQSNGAYDRLWRRRVPATSS